MCTVGLDFYFSGGIIEGFFFWPGSTRHEKARGRDGLVSWLVLVRSSRSLTDSYDQCSVGKSDKRKSARHIANATRHLYYDSCVFGPGPFCRGNSKPTHAISSPAPSSCEFQIGAKLLRRGTYFEEGSTKLCSRACIFSAFSVTIIVAAHARIISRK